MPRAATHHLAAASLLGALAMLLTGCAAAVAQPETHAPVGHGDMQFLGEWTGGLDRSGEGVVHMIVSAAAADGTTFSGDLTYTADGAETTATVRASMTPHGHLVAAIGENASLEAHITDPATLDYCFVRYGFDPVYSCGRLVRGA